MRTSLPFVIAGLLLMGAGCAQAPTEKIAAAEKAVEEARTAGAPDYLAEDFTKLDGMLASAKTEIADQGAKFALLRDYQKAEQLLTAVQADAERVKTETAKKKEEAKAAAVQAQKEAQDAVKTAQGLVVKAPVGKDRAALEAIKADVQGLEKSLGEVQTALDAGDFKAAMAKAKAIQEKSQAVSTELQTAIAKVGGAKARAKTATKK
jgi:hypothetical protein